MERKKLIFLLRLAFWLHRTQTGILHELKWYGIEHTYHTLFATLPDEWHRFRHEYETKKQLAQCIIHDITRSKPSGTTPLIVRDIALMEGSICLAYSQKISIESLIEDISTIG